MNMNRKMWRLASLLLLPMLFAVLLLPGKTFARNSSCTAVIPVQVQVSGEDVPSDVEYHVILEAVSQDAPLPGNTDLILENGSRLEFGPITYTVPGDYTYRVRQETGNAEHFTYDQAFYDVTVRVVNDENGGLKAEVWAVREGSADKADTIRFENGYDKPSSGSSKHHHSPSSDPAVPQAAWNLLAPQTGDSANLVLWISLIAATTLVLICAAAMRRRRRDEIS